MMSRRSIATLLLLLTACVAVAVAPAARAQLDENVELTVDTTSSGVRLTWAGGDPEFAVHRSTSPTAVDSTSSVAFSTLDRQWTDLSTAGDLVFYRVRGRSTCLTATADSFVRSDFPAVEFGGVDVIEAWHSGPEALAYVQFALADVLPPTAEILDATLILQQVDGAPGSAIEASQLLQPWTEPGVNYVNRPAAGLSYWVTSHPTTTGERKWSVTGLVQEWVSGSEAPFGIELSGLSSGDHAVYASREDVPPLLCIEWTTALESSANVLRAESAIPPVITTDRGIATSVEAEVTTPFGHQILAALWFLDRYSGLYDLDDVLSELFLDRLVTDETGRTTIVFGTRHANIGDRTGQIAVEVDESIGGGPVTVYGVGARALPAVQKVRPAQPVVELTPHQARLTAEEAVGAVDVVRLGEPFVEWFDPNVDVPQGEEVRPAWRVAFQAQSAAGAGWINWVVHVDAEDGSVLRSFRDEQTAGDRPGENFVIRSANDTNRNLCWDFVTVDDKWFDEAGPVSGYPGLPADDFLDGANAFDFTHLVYHDYYDRFLRESWDGGGKKVRAFVDVSDPDGPDGAQWTNASYSRACNAMKFGDGWATDDIVAHEFTHGVVRWTAGLKYENQSGALNESFADTFAAFATGNGWLLGEGRYGGSDPIRNMANPPDLDDPDHVEQELSGDLTGLRDAVADPDDTNDYGSVHTNSGIPNKVAYLVTEGDVHNGVLVPGMGHVKAARLYYSVLSHKLHKNSNFQDARDEFVKRARYFWQANLYNFSVDDVCSVINGWASVGYGTPDFDCDGYADAGSGDGDGDGIPNVRDNCIAERNADQADLDGDGFGDACDADTDGDGVRDIDDNCVRDANANQNDVNGDGIGDLCDDFDNDGLLAPVDNCPNDANRDQRDTDGDGFGDACDGDDDNDGTTDGQDNCPLTFNNQSDSDGDGVGNACDNCSVDYNPDQANADNDGQGDVCDSDDDNDGLLDGDDNCPQYANPRQIDNDMNGQGMWCDVGELALLVGFAEDVELAIAFENLDPDEPVRFPVFPCERGISCPDVMPELFEVQVAVDIAPAHKARIVDDRGWVVADAEFDAGGSATLTFATDHEYWYDTGGGVPPFEGRRYFLELLAPPGATAGVVTGVIDVDTTTVVP